MAILNLSGARGMPLFRQAEAAECGLACVGMIAAAHGYRTDLATLRRNFAISLKGATLKDIINIASRLNLGARAIRCELEALSDLRLPAVLHWNMNHFVVLKEINRGTATIFDPAIGKRKLSLEQVGSHFTGVALELTPTNEFKSGQDRTPLKLSKVIQLDAHAWKAVVQGLLLSVFLQIFILLAPYFIQLIIDEAILKGDLSLLLTIALGFALLKLFEALTSVTRALVFQFLSSIMAFDMRARLFHHVARLPLPFFHRRHIGDIQQRFSSLGPIRDFITTGAIAAVIDGVLAVFLGIVIFMYNTTLGFIVVGFILIFATLRIAFLALAKRLSADMLVADAAENSKFLETLRAMQTIKVAGIETEREGNWRNLAAETLNAKIRIGNLNIGYTAISQTLLGLSNILVIYLAAASAIGGGLTIGMITAFVAYKSQFEQKLMGLIDVYVDYRLLDVHLDRVADIALQKREQIEDTYQTDRTLTGAVEINGLHFQYAPFEPEILSGASLSIQPGEFVAISAPSGEGKSTLLRLLLCLYEPTSGSIRFDGLEADQWGAANLRRQIGVVMQDDALLAGSIEENISLFDDRPDRARIKAVARMTAIDADIEAMPMGYRSLVGDMGTTLSGGQKQRVILARALYRDPKLLIMDEATSALDVPTERRINNELKMLKITRIVAAHRPETLASADRIIALKDGKLSEIGQALHSVPKELPASNIQTDDNG